MPNFNFLKKLATMMVFFSAFTAYSQPSHQFILERVDVNYLKEEQDWFIFDVSVKNDGSLSALTGSITISFPDYSFKIEDEEQNNWIENIDTSNDGTLEVRSAGGSKGLFKKIATINKLDRIVSTILRRISALIRVQALLPNQTVELLHYIAVIQKRMEWREIDSLDGFTDELCREVKIKLKLNEASA